MLLSVFVSRLVLAFSIAHWHGTQEWHTPDSGSYLVCAEELLEGGFTAGGRAEIVRTPGYPFLLLPGAALGFAPLYGILLNALASVAVAWLVWHLAMICTGNAAAATGAGILYLLEPISWVAAAKLLTETSFSALILLFVLLLHGYFQTGRMRNAVLAAVILAASTYVRPVSLYLGIFLAPLGLFYPRDSTFPRRVLGLALFQLCFAALILPWFARNYRQTELVGFSSISDQALYFYSAASVQARLQNKTFEKMQHEMGWLNRQGYESAHPEQKNWPRGRIANFQRAEAKRILRENFWLYLPMHLKGCVVMLIDPGATELLKILKLYPPSTGLLARITDEGLVPSALWLVRNHPASIAALVGTGLLLACIYVCAAVSLARIPLSVALLFLAVAAYFVLTSGGPMAVARYRHPIMPVLCVAAGAGLGAIRQGFLLSKGSSCR